MVYHVLCNVLGNVYVEMYMDMNIITVIANINNHEARRLNRHQLHHFEKSQRDIKTHFQNNSNSIKVHGPIVVNWYAKNLEELFSSWKFQFTIVSNKISS